MLVKIFVNGWLMIRECARGCIGDGGEEILLEVENWGLKVDSIKCPTRCQLAVKQVFSTAESIGECYCGPIPLA